MHLAVFSQQGTIGIYHDRGVVEQSFGTLLKQRHDQHDVMLGRDLAEGFGRRPGDGFGKTETVGVFTLAEVT